MKHIPRIGVPVWTVAFFLLSLLFLLYSLVNDINCSSLLVCYGPADGCRFKPRCGRNLEGALVAGEVPGYLQRTARVSLSKYPTPKSLPGVVSSCDAERQ